MVKRCFHGDTIEGFLAMPEAQIVGNLTTAHTSLHSSLQGLQADATGVRLSFYLEDVATEFDVQGLELDWSCVVWDGDFRYTPDGWSHHSFCGDKWQNINKPERKAFQKNAYRVLLTRARQGMVLVVPEGNPEDPTRNPAYYDSTYKYLKDIGIQTI